MLLSYPEFQKQYQADRGKLQTILDHLAKAPAKYRQYTEHIANLGELTPYVYYTAIVRKYLKKKAKIMDWGAFLGQITYLLQDDFEVSAYNPYDNAEIGYWHKQLGINKPVFDPDFSKLKQDLAAESYDAVISSGVLEHTFEHGITDVEALRYLNRLLKPGGHLFIWNLPTTHALAEKIAADKKRWRHIVRYDFEEIIIKLNLTGFDIVKIEHDELIYTKLAKLFKGLDLTRVWKFDQRLARLPLLRKYAHHFTIVAQKVENFPIKPAASGYTAYLDV